MSRDALRELEEYLKPRGFNARATIWFDEELNKPGFMVSLREDFVKNFEVDATDLESAILAALDKSREGK